MGARYAEAFMPAPLGGYPEVFPLISGELEAQMVNEVATRVASERGRSDGNLWESLAELDQTIGFFKKPLGAFENFYKKNLSGSARKRNNPDAPRDAAGAAANAWLQWQYGLKPLISDVNNIIAGLKKKVRHDRKTTRASLNESQQKLVFAEFRRGDGFWYDVVVQTTDFLSIRGMSIDEVYNDIGSNIGFTSKGLITLPWELVPYSFVADWFANVGDYLGAIAPAFTTTQLGSCMVSKRVNVAHFSLENMQLVGSIGSSLEMVKPMTGRYSVYQNTSSRSPGLPSPSVALKVGNPFKSVERALSGLSLAFQQVDGEFGRNGRLPRH
jgi:hypothetical protein